MNWETILIATLPVVSAVLVAVFNNFDKINPSKRKIKEMHELVNLLKRDIKDHSEKFDDMSNKVDTISSAQRTSLQTHILANCKSVQDAINHGDIDYEEELKQLIILYREYYLCGYNSQGKLYFNDTIAKAADDNNTLLHELMNTYFPEYNPKQNH